MTSGTSNPVHRCTQRPSPTPPYPMRSFSLHSEDHRLRLRPPLLTVPIWVSPVLLNRRRRPTRTAWSLILTCLPCTLHLCPITPTMTLSPRSLSLLGPYRPLLHGLVLRQNKICPSLRRLRFLPHYLGKHFHPAFFLRGTISIEVNSFPISEADSEAFFDEHVALFFRCECGSTARATFAGNLLLCERRFVVDELASFCKVDGGAGLAGGFVVSGKFGILKTEEATTPVLLIVRSRSSNIATH